MKIGGFFYVGYLSFASPMFCFPSKIAVVVITEFSAVQELSLLPRKVIAAVSNAKGKCALRVPPHFGSLQQGNHPCLIVEPCDTFAGSVKGTALLQN